MSHPPASNRDEIDRLFARLEAAPPPTGFAERILASTVHRAATWPALAAGLVSLVLLTVSGYQVGASLASSTALDLLLAVTSDTGLLATAPGDVVAAVGEVIPWGLLVLAVASAACVIWATGRLAMRARVLQST